VGISKFGRFHNATSGKTLAEKAGMADSFLTRLRGLLWRRPLQPGEGLYLTGCRSIHMFGMKYAIDAVFLDRAGSVVGVVRALPPGAVSRFYRAAEGCLELPAGTIEATGTQVGDTVERTLI